MSKTLQSTAAKRQRNATDRDLMAQLQGVKAIVTANQEALNDALAGSLEDDSPGTRPGYCVLFDTAALKARQAEARAEGERQLSAELQEAETLGAVRRLAKPPSTAALQALEQDFPHFAGALELLRRRFALATVTPGLQFSMPPMLLTGDPGVGKTAFAEALARALAQPYRRVDIASTTAGFALAGSHSSWNGAKHGAVWSLLQAPSASGVLLLEELDKAAQSNFPVLGSLYALLEPVSSTHFVDEYVGLPVDASHLVVIATCNDPGRLDSALRSRFHELHVPMPDQQQMAAVARSVYRQLRATRAWTKFFDAELPDFAIESLQRATPRVVARTLEEAHARAAAAGRLRLEPQDFAVASPVASERRRIGFV
mgnify:CR=1 FL=1